MAGEQQRDSGVVFPLAIKEETSSDPAGPGTI